MSFPLWPGENGAIISCSEKPDFPTPIASNGSFRGVKSNLISATREDRGGLRWTWGDFQARGESLLKMFP